MKTVFIFFAVAVLSIFSTSTTNLGINNETNLKREFKNNISNASISKIFGFDYDISTLANYNDAIFASSKAHPPYSKRGIYESLNNINFRKVSIEGEMNSMVSTSKGELYLAASNNLYKATNKNNSFNEVENFHYSVNCIGINQANELYIGSRNILYYSTDGIIFNKIYDFDNLNIQKIIVAKNDTMYLIVGRGLDAYAFKSVDKGYNFTKIPNIKFVSDICVNSINKVYILGSGLYKSSDNGMTFNEIVNTRRRGIISLFIGSSNMLYIATVHSIEKLNADNTFDIVWNLNESINIAMYGENGIIWIGTEHGLFKLWFT